MESIRATKVAAACLISLSVAACSGNNQPSGSTSRPSTVQSSVAAGAIAINIVTKAHAGQSMLTDIAIQPTSSVGGAPFCSGGTAVDGPGNPDIGHIARTITCRDGTILMGLELQPNGKNGTWRIVSGTGSYTGWTGSGTLEVAILDDANHVAQEVFGGTVVR